MWCVQETTESKVIKSVDLLAVYPQRLGELKSVSIRKLNIILLLRAVRLK